MLMEWGRVGGGRVGAGILVQFTQSQRPCDFDCLQCGSTTYRRGWMLIANQLCPGPAVQKTQSVLTGPCPDILSRQSRPHPCELHYYSYP